jgi:hypothetical protein
MAQAVSFQPRTAEFQVQFQTSLCGICSGKSGIGQVLLLVLAYRSIHSFSHSSLDSV